MKVGLFALFFDKVVFDTFPNKDQVYEIKQEISDDYIPNSMDKTSE